MTGRAGVRAVRGGGPVCQAVRMSDHPVYRHPQALASDEARLARLFGHTDLLPLWIAEPYVSLAPTLSAAIEDRAAARWYGYETRPRAVIGSFRDWMEARHGWTTDDLVMSVSPSVGTSIGVLLEHLTDEGDGVILQPPVFTDFKPLVVSAGRTVVRNPLQLTADGYRMDLDGLAAAAAQETTRFMILCNPHNPVGRAWRPEELRSAAEICAANDVFVLADEIHADLVLAPHRFSPFAVAAEGAGVTWAATHGPIKTFGLAGVCDTLLISASDAVAAQFRQTSNRLHLTRNNVFATAAFETAYRTGGPWLDGLLSLVAENAAMLAAELESPLGVVPPEATYLAWLDLRSLAMDARDLASWIAEAGVALSPGHWFGRDGAGFARMTIAAPPEVVAEGAHRLNEALP